MLPAGIAAATVAANTAVFVLAALALAGWFTGRPRLASLGGGWIPMAPNTALGFLLLAAAAAALQAGRKRLALLVVAPLVAVAVARTVEFVGAVHLEVDRWVFDFPAAQLGLAPVGRMAFFTALDLLFLAVALVLLAWPGARRRAHAAAALLAAAAGLSGLTFAVAYLYDQPLAYGGAAIPMALSTALALVAASVALVLRATAEATRERRRLEARLRDSEALFRTVFEAAPVGVALLDGGEGVERANRAFAAVVGEEPAAGTSLLDLLGPAAAGLAAEPLARLVDGGEPFAGEVSLRARDGEERSGWLQLLAVAVGRRSRVLVLLRETSDERRARSFLEDAKRLLEERVRVRTAELMVRNRELEDFAYVASHDLQEPLRKVQAFGDRLASRWGDALGEEGRDYLRRMRDAATRMRRLIDDLLTFSRVTTRGQPFTPTDLGAVAREALADLEVRVDETGARVEVAPLPVIEADPAQMHQLLQNLVGNALKYHRTGEPPQVRVWSEPAAEDGDRIVLHVRDEGIGFDERYLDRIFAPFQRLHGRGEYEGSGIGLAVCRRIVERHGGSLTARSTPGEGATFLVTLPRRHAQGEVST